MFKVIRIGPDEYILKTDRNAIQGERLRLMAVMYSLGVALYDIEACFMAFETTDHNLADFGINKTFMYSMRLSS